MNFCVDDIKHIKTTENKLERECNFRTSWSFFVLRPSLRRANLLISKQCLPFEAVCDEISTVTPGFPMFFFIFFFFRYLIRTVKYIFEEENKV